MIKDVENLHCKRRVSVLTWLNLKERCEKRNGKILFKHFKGSWGGCGVGRNLFFVAIVNNRI